MDCQMPEVDGYTATRVIRQRDRDIRHTPIIAVTAHALEGERDKCLAAGMDDYLAKPLRIPELAALVRRLPSLAGDDARRPRQRGGRFDAAALSDIGDPETEAALVSMFLEQAARRLPELRQAIDGADAERLAELAHGLKGTAATVGARGVSELCDALGQLAAEGITPRATEIQLDLVDALQDTRAAMNAYIEEIIA
jgi:CheY-like chemotaxis protein